MFSRIGILHVFFILFVLILGTPHNGYAITTEFSLGDTIRWSITGVSDSKIHCDPIVQDAGTNVERQVCLAPIRSGSNLEVEVEMQNPSWVGTSGQFPQSERRELAIGIPYKGNRYIAKKIYYYDPSFTTLNLRHKTSFSPYQADPPYIDSRHQADKWVQIQVAHFEYDLGVVYRYIWVIPSSVVGYPNSEQNGLPVFARTDPDIVLEDPEGCNDCSPVGLPGYTVNMATLRPVIKDTIFAWNSLGPDVDLSLVWNAELAAARTNFGSGWRFSYDSWLTESAQGATIEREDGGTSFFALPPEANLNVQSVATTSQGSTITVEYSVDPETPAYDAQWDGYFGPDSSGNQLKKVLDGDPSKVTFVFTPAGTNQSYIYQKSVLSSGELPLVAIEDWNGNRLQIERNSSGAITEITDATGRKATLAYTAGGQCSSIVVPGGASASFSYASGDLIQSVDLIGNVTNYSYDTSKRVTEMATNGLSWSFSWADDNEKTYLSSTSDPEGKVTSYEIVAWDFSVFTTRKTDGDGRSFDYYFPNGRYKNDDQERKPSLTYDNSGKLIAMYEKGDQVTPFRTFEYYSNGYLSKVTENGVAEHLYTYNDQGQVTSYTDALGGVWRNEYDAKGNLVEQVTPVGREKHFYYNVLGQMVQFTDPEGNSTIYTYDSWGNVASMTDAEGGQTSFGYDNTGINLTQVNDPLGNITSMTYDANRRLVRTTFPDGTYTEREYNGFAQTGYRNEAGNRRTVIRNASQDVTSETDFLGNTRTMDYDSGGRLIQSTDPAGYISTISYNDLGQPFSVTNSLGKTFSWSYYSNSGNFASITLSDEDPPATAYLDSGWYGLANIDGKRYAHDLMGRLKNVITPRDYWKRISFTRDADGLITAKNFNDSPLATFTRDGNGNIITTTHELGTDAMQRNKRGQVAEQNWFDGKTASFSYNVRGDLTSMRYPDNSVATYSYDSRNRITTISWKGASLTFSYDSVGNTSRVQRSNSIQTTLTSDKNGALTRAVHSRNTEIFLDLSCTRDERRLLSSCTKDGSLPWGPVLSPENTSSEYVYNQSFTLATRNDETATTDPNGNQTSMPGTRNFSGTYDFQNLLTNWTANSVASTATYDGRNRLIRWTRGNLIRNYHYDEQDRLLFATDANGILTGLWLYRGNEIVAMADSNGLYFYHSDLSGNTSFLSRSDGAIVATYRYMPYGLQRGSQSEVENPFTFVGPFGVIDLKDGLYYMRSRTYDSVSRAFLSNDILNIGASLNSRSYGSNNPVNFIDPDGLAPFCYDCEQPLYSGADGLGSTTPPRAPTLRERRGLPPQSSSSSDIDPCIVGTAWNAAGSIKGNFGFAAGVAQTFDLLAQGEYGDAALQAGSTAAGAVSSTAGAFLLFMSPSQPDGLEDERLRQQFPEAYQSNQKRSSAGTSSEPYQFTLPEFSLDD